MSRPKHTKAQALVWQSAYNRSLNASSAKALRTGDFSARTSTDAHVRAIRAGDAAVAKMCRGGRCIRGRIAR